MRFNKSTLLLTYATALLLAGAVQMGYLLLASSGVPMTGPGARALGSACFAAVSWLVVDLLIARFRLQLASTSVRVEAGPSGLRPLSEVIGVYFFLRALVVTVIAAAVFLIVGGTFFSKWMAGNLRPEIEGWGVLLGTVVYWMLLAPMVRRIKAKRLGKVRATCALIPGGVRITIPIRSEGRPANNIFDVRFDDLVEARVVSGDEAQVLVEQAGTANIGMMIEQVRSQVNVARGAANPTVFLFESDGDNLLLRGRAVFYVIAVERGAGHQVVEAFQARSPERRIDDAL